MADYVTYLEDYLASIDNLPSEIHHIFDEIGHKDQLVSGIQETIQNHDVALRKLIRSIPVEDPSAPLPSPAPSPTRPHRGNSIQPLSSAVLIKADPATFTSTSSRDQTDAMPISATDLPSKPATSGEGAAADITSANGTEKVEATNSDDPETGKASVHTLLRSNEDVSKICDTISDFYAQAISISDEKVRLAERTLMMLDRHLRRLTNDMEKIVESEPGVGTPLQVSLSTAASSSVTQPSTSHSAPAGAVSARPSNSVGFSPAMASSSAVRMLRESSEDSSVPRTIKRRATTMTGRSMHPQKKKLKRTKTNLGSSPTPTLSAEAYSSASSPERTLVDDDEMDNSPDTDEQLYCFCRQVSYGEMIACDGEDCPNEWFHLECVGLTETPKGSWFCPDCRKKQRKVK
ncbi:hypothetical protein BJ742DRAFT_752892 [Cladochytrium replicatum]|nr:hypothetical protein BJ742DRAFT_752892 [Cladochytrium replicatum]